MSFWFLLSRRRRVEIFVCFAAAFLVSCSHHPTTETVTISNVEPRRDVNGQILDVHAGCLQFFNGRFYLYGSSFGTNRDYDAFDSPLVVYSSPDLQTWSFAGNLLKSPPHGLYCRPSVVFNSKTKKYVVWFNWYPKLWQGQDGVAVSDNPIGPFVIVSLKEHLRGSCPGDGSLFVDDDGMGYYIYTDIAEDYAVRVERLTPDFLESSGKISNVMSTETEAPVLFRRGNIYYALTGPCCASCLKGSEVQVFTSLSPLGPFSTELSANINRRSNDSHLLPSTNTVSGNPTHPRSTNSAGEDWFTFQPGSSIPIIPAQQSCVTQIRTAGGSVYIWTGDRWGANPDGRIDNNFQFWEPLEFADDGRILPLKDIPRWYVTWTFNQ